MRETSGSDRHETDLPQLPNIGRRKALTLGAAAAAAGAASLIAGPGQAQADDGNPLLLGTVNSAANTTAVTTDNGYALEGYAGSDTSFTQPLPDLAGVVGIDNTGYNNVGVAGASASGTGVTGVGATHGVTGTCDEGVGVLASSKHGTALKVDGLVTFSRSGVAKIRAHKKSVTVTSVFTVVGVSTVLATVQGSPEDGVYIKGVVVNTEEFTIELNKATKSELRVAWLVLD